MVDVLSLVVFSLTLDEPFICTDGADPLPCSLL